jgi:hypothetical protein
MSEREAFPVGRAAFDPTLDPMALLDAGAAFYSRGEMEESERFDEFASDLAEIRALPEVTA